MSLQVWTPCHLKTTKNFKTKDNNFEYREFVYYILRLFKTCEWLFIASYCKQLYAGIKIKCIPIFSPLILDFFSIFAKIVYIALWYMIIQYGSEPVLIQRIVIGTVPGKGENCLNERIIGGSLDEFSLHSIIFL